MLSKLLIISTLYLIATYGVELEKEAGYGPGMSFKQNGHKYCLTLGKKYETEASDSGECNDDAVEGTTKNFGDDDWSLDTDDMKMTNGDGMGIAVHVDSGDSSSSGDSKNSGDSNNSGDSSDDDEVSIELSGNHEFSKDDSNLVIEMHFEECDDNSADSKSDESNSKNDESSKGSQSSHNSEDSSKDSHNSNSKGNDDSKNNNSKGNDGGDMTTSADQPDKTSNDGSHVTVTGDDTTSSDHTSTDGPDVTGDDTTSVDGDSTKQSGDSQKSHSSSKSVSQDSSKSSSQDSVTRSDSHDSEEDKKELEAKIIEMLESIEATKNCDDNSARRRLGIEKVKSDVCKMEHEDGKMKVKVSFENFGDCTLTATSNAVSLSTRSQKDQDAGSSNYYLTVALFIGAILWIIN